MLNALEGKTLPVYGTGANVRDWLYVEDHARALWLVATKGRVGEVYNIGGANERTNIDVVRTICRHLDDLLPRTCGHYADLITFVKDRPGHDRRYAINATKIARSLGWQPAETFESGLLKTIQWYLGNMDWIASIETGAYRSWIETNYASRDQ